MKTTAIKTLALFLMLMLGMQAQAQNIDEKMMVGTYKFHLTQDIESEDMPMTLVLDGTITFNADHKTMREGTMDVLIPINDGEYTNTFILTYTFKSNDETWKLEDDKWIGVVNSIDVKYSSAKAEKTDIIGSMFLGEITKEAPALADGLKQTLVGTSTETIKSIDDKGIISVDNSGREIVYTRQ